jgi:hypothetical protein
MNMLNRMTRILIAASLLLLGSSALVNASEEALQKQIDAIMGGLPKFAVPMREVGDRFQNMYFAAKDKNWGLAYYMSKYMFKAMNPAAVTKPNEYPEWKDFYEKKFAPVNKAIEAQDFKAFEKEYLAVIMACNQCHADMGYAFIKVKKLASPPDAGIDYSVPSNAADVPK